MKNTTLIVAFAALAPFLAIAGRGELKSKVNVQELQDDIAVTKVIGAEVKSQTEEDIGEVQDVMIASDGQVEAVLVEGPVASPADETAGGTVDDQRTTATETEDMAVEGGIPGIPNDDLTEIQWSQVSYDEQEESISVDSGQPGMSGSKSMMDQDRGSSFKASEIVGMEVHLSDAESFGEVEDVLIDEREGKASALLVDTWEGFDKRTYALPVELTSVNRDEQSLTYGYTKNEVTEQPEYEKQ